MFSTGLVKGHFYGLHGGPFRGTDASIANAPADRVLDSERKTDLSRPHQSPDSALRHTDTSHEAIERQPKGQPEDDGKSVNSNMKDMSLWWRRNTPSNTRAAAKVAQGQSPEEVCRPSKLRSASIESSARLPPTFQSSQPEIHIPSTNSEMEKIAWSAPPTSPVFNTSTERDYALLLQPETRPITQEQLVNEVKGISAGLAMVEKKCVEVCILISSILSTAN